MTQDARSSSRRRLLAATGALVTVGVAGCLGDEEEDDPEEAGDDGHDHDDGHDDHDHDDGHDHDDDHDDHGGVNELGVDEFEVLDRDQDEAVIAYIHGDHWHDDPLEVPLGDNLSLGAAVEDEDGEQIALEEGLELEVDVHEGDLDIDHHGDHVHVYGEEEGFGELAFQLVEDGEVVYETPALETEVADQDNDDDEGGVGELNVAEFEVLDRDQDEAVIAYVHGDHWHDDPLEVPLGDNLSLGAAVEDEDGEQIALEEGLELEVDVHEGDLDIDHHGDHVHVYGEEEGFGEIAFKLVEDGEIRYETPGLETTVE